MGLANGICVEHENHPYISEIDNGRGLALGRVDIENTHIEIMGHRIDGYEDVEEFLKDLEECKEAQHRWNELKVFLMKYRREKTPQYLIGSDGNVRSTNVNRYCVAMSITDILAKMEELEKEY